MIRRKLAILGSLVVLAASAFAQASPPLAPPAELDRVVDRIALYPDPLLAQVLAAATYPDQIPEAYRWADQHHYLTGQPLADAIQADQLPWDPSVQALLPFPSVLETMSADMNWTQQLGNAFLAQQADVMDAVQRERAKARSYGYLSTNRWVTVSSGPYIAITPVDPYFITVPWWDPAVVYFPPRAGFVVGGAIRFGFGVSIGTTFRPWGWGYNRFDWGSHLVIVNDAPWRRTWATRATYVHPYTLRRPIAVRPPEIHRLQERSVRERGAPQRGERGREEHRFR